MAQTRSRPSIAELRARAQPAEVLDRYSAEHWAGSLYMRRLSIYVTWLLVRAGIPADTVTVAMALVGLAGASLFGVRGIWAPLAGVLLIQLYLLLDCSDGEIARWHGTSGARGIYLDRLGHYLVEAALFIALGIRAHSWGSLVDGHASGFVVMGVAAAVLHIVAKVETDLVHVARAKAGLPAVADDRASAAPRARGLARLRRVAAAFPLYRLTGAIEASLVATVIVLADEIRGSIVATERMMIGALALTAVVAVGHLVMILASNRLR